MVSYKGPKPGSEREASEEFRINSASLQPGVLNYLEKQRLLHFVCDDSLFDFLRVHQNYIILKNYFSM